jgi:hypothetical protein
MRPLLLLALSLPLLAQESPQPGCLPAFKAQVEGVLRQDPLDAWRNYCREGMAFAVVEVVGSYTEQELSDLAFEESIALLKQRLREMWHRYGDAAGRERPLALAGERRAQVYPLGRSFKP